MEKNSKIFVAGHKGLVGSAIMRMLEEKGYENIITRTRKDLDLTHQREVSNFFLKEKPEYVFLCAAKVGGIYANSKYPADFIYQNLVIQNNVLHESHVAGVKRLMFLGSSCIYPKECRQPIKEEYLLSAPLEPSNSAYAVAKIAGIEMCGAYNMQHQTRFVSVMPCNLYGPGDNYDLKTSHVLPAFIRKMHEAKIRNDKNVMIWGTGKPKREFLYSEDMAKGCIFLMNLPDNEFQALCFENQPPIINLGTGEDLSIADLAATTAKVVGFKGELTYDPSMPDGTMRKVLDVSKINALGWSPQIKLEVGIKLAYKEWKSRI